MARLSLALSLSLCFFLVSFQAWQTFAEDKNVFVVGHVYCDQCLNHNLTNNAFFLEGASVFIQCKDTKGFNWKTIIATTNEKGYFQAKLHGDFNPTCYAHVKSSPNTLCTVNGLDTKKSSDFKFAYSVDNNVTYSIGEFTFTPSSVPSLCQQLTSSRTMPPNIPNSSLHRLISPMPSLHGNKTLKPSNPPLHGTKPPKPNKSPLHCPNPSKSPKTRSNRPKRPNKSLHKPKAPKDRLKKSLKNPTKKPRMHGSNPHKHHKHHKNHKHHKSKKNSKGYSSLCGPKPPKASNPLINKTPLYGTKALKTPNTPLLEFSP